MRIACVLVTLLGLAITPKLSAQWTMVTEIEKSMSFGTRPGFAVSFPNTDIKLVDNVWTDFVKNNFGSKLKKGKKGEKSASACRSASVSAGDFTLYSEVEKVGDGAQLNAWFDVGVYFLNRNDDPTRTNETKDLLNKYYFEVRRAAADLEVKAEEDKLKDLDNKIKKLKRDNDNLNKDIANYKAKLKKAEEDLVQNQKDQEATLIDMDRQREAVEQANQRKANVENERQ
jgi:hypothetical protein